MGTIAHTLVITGVVTRNPYLEVRFPATIIYMPGDIIMMMAVLCMIDVNDTLVLK